MYVCRAWALNLGARVCFLACHCPVGPLLGGFLFDLSPTYPLLAVLALYALVFLIVMLGFETHVSRAAVTAVAPSAKAVDAVTNSDSAAPAVARPSPRGQKQQKKSNK
jgi:hypothetical protein